VYYPDIGVSSDRCYPNPQFKAVKLHRYKIESSKNTDLIKTGIFNSVPLLAVAKVGLEFMFYQSGIMDLTNSYFTSYHPLVIEGYGKEGTV
jgi:hypothetical protein